MKEPNLLEFKNVTKHFRIGGGLFSRKIVRAVESVSFSLPSDKPSIMALVGESGSGKTTIAKMILGIEEPTSGEILYKGRRVSEWLKKNRIEYLREVQPIFQDPYSAYNPFYRVERVLEVVIDKFGLASSKEEKQKIMIEGMEAIGLRPREILGRYPHQISGGERQRLMLARIFIMKPKLIIADEPVSMIDVSLKAIFLENLASFKEKLKASCIYITHDLHTAHFVSDDIVILCYGNIVEKGPIDLVVREPLHPYTKLLIDSIPIPDPRKRKIAKKDIISSTLELVRVEQGCIFSGRCPKVMDRCKKEKPPLIKVDSNREVACYLYET